MNPQSWVGETINNRYRIDELLGQGGMSTVYKGFDPNLERPVAIKIVHSFLALHDKFVQRFQREASSVARLRHPNIVQVYDFNQIEDTYFMVMEYIEGVTLQNTIDGIRSGEAGVVPIHDLIGKGEKLASAMDYAHRAGLIHRDVKPANIMIQPDGEPLLMDFGIAKLVDTAQNITNTGAVMGTVSYMSPEQVRGEEIDGRADQYALGVILYELMSGRRPFEGDTTFQTMMKHIHDPVPKLQSLYPPEPVSQALIEVVYQTLAKKPADRYPDSAALVAALQLCRRAETHTADTRLELSTPIISPPPQTITRPQTPREQRQMAEQRIKELQAILLSEPLKEDLQLELMDLLARRGDFLTALKQYNSYQKLLDHELGVEPMPDTVRHRDQIMSARMTPWNNLKPEITPFLGRSEEIRRLSAMITHPDTRLLTISGSGGMGKTRLARRIIRQLGSHQWRYFMHGVLFVPLAMLDSEADIIYAIASACDIVLAGQDEPLTLLAKTLKQREILLVLDNFEHLTAHAPLVFQLLQEAPKLKVLVTSRHRLNLPGETVFPLSGLTYSQFDNDFDATAELDDGPRLFMQASRKLNPEFSMSETDHFNIFRICEIVDGIPLGIELAASWTRVLTCREIVERLEADLKLLTNDQTPVTERHRDLRAVFQYSWDLLSPEEQSILAALSIFRGPFEFQAAADIAGATADGVAGLVDKSLLQAVVLRDTTQVALGRIYSVHEIVRYYAQEMLAADPSRQESITAAHLEYYASYTAAQDTPLRSAGQREAWEGMQRNISNIRQAWQNGLRGGRFNLISQMLEPIYRYYEMGALYLEGKQFFSEAIAALPLDPPFELFHQLHGRLAAFNMRLANYDEVNRVCNGCVESWEQYEPDSFLSKKERAFLLSIHAEMFNKQGNFAEAAKLIKQAKQLYEEIDWLFGIAAATHRLGIVDYLQGNFMQAYLEYEEALRRYREMGEEVNAAHIQANLALFQIAMQQFEEGKKGLKANLEITRQWHNKQRIGTNLLNLAFTNMALQQFEEGKQEIEESLLYFRETGDRESEATALLVQGQIEWELENKSIARRIFFNGLNMALDIGATPKVLEFLATLCVLLIEDGRFDEAWPYLRFVDQHPQANQMAHVRAKALLMRTEDHLAPEKMPELEQTIEALTVEGIAEALREGYQI